MHKKQSKIKMIDINSLDKFIKSKENKVPNIRLDTEKKIIWSSKNNQKQKQAWYLFMAFQQPVLN